MVPVPTLPGVMVAVALVEPSGMVTVAGRVTNPAGNTDRLITWPPEPTAGAVTIVTVKVAVEFAAMFSGLGVRAIGFKPAVIDTVAGWLRQPTLGERHMGCCCICRCAIHT